MSTNIWVVVWESFSTLLVTLANLDILKMYHANSNGCIFKVIGSWASGKKFPGENLSLSHSCNFGEPTLKYYRPKCTSEIHEFQDFYILRIQNFEMVDEKRVTSTGTASVSYKHFRFPRKEGRKSYHRSSCDFRIKVFHENPEKSTLFFATLKIMLSNHFRLDDTPIKVIRLELKTYLVFIPTLKPW